jgi:hypothetical protein
LSARDSAGSLAGRAIRSALEDARIDFDLVDRVPLAQQGPAAQSRYGASRLAIFSLLSVMAAYRPAVLSAGP